MLQKNLLFLQCFNYCFICYSVNQNATSREQIPVMYRNFENKEINWSEIFFDAKHWWTHCIFFSQKIRFLSFLIRNLTRHQIKFHILISSRPFIQGNGILDVSQVVEHFLSLLLVQSVFLRYFFILHKSDLSSYSFCFSNTLLSSAKKFCFFSATSGR